MIVQCVARHHSPHMSSDSRLDQQSKAEHGLTESGGPGVASTLRRPFPGGIGSGS